MMRKHLTEFEKVLALKGLTITQLAKEFGVSRTTASSWANNGKGPSLTVGEFQRLSEILGISWEELPKLFSKSNAEETQPDETL
jgi:transcriptional regulator with XRE-family HTH domain